MRKDFGIQFAQKPGDRDKSLIDRNQFLQALGLMSNTARKHFKKFDAGLVRIQHGTSSMIAG
ncbi:MAG: hypothetical protein EOR73_31800 [Mesorhizobium sp.]|nr:MAG: hypothetical protein EOR73_31800 [Mesorhizobium sp.]